MAASPKTPPMTGRRHSLTHSVASMRDWNERQLTMEDIEEFMDLDATNDHIIHRKLQTRLETYNGPNPFVTVLPFTWYEKLKMFLFTVSGILLAKILIFLLIIIFCYIGCAIKNCCCKSGTSLILNLYLRAWDRIALFFVFGLYWIPVKYANGSKPDKWPKIITPNHISMVDALIVYYLTGAVFVAKKELQNLPMFGAMMTALGVVFVDRSSKKARRGAVNTIKKQATDPSSVPLTIFPQGTCSNTLTLTQFKYGAFIPGVAVLPTALIYTNCFCDMALFGGMLIRFIHVCCQFINFARVVFLEPYRPSEQEQSDPVAFAANVREIVAETLGAALTPHTFDDLLLQAFAYNLEDRNSKGMQAVMAPYVMDDCHRQLQMKAKTVIELAKIYLTHCDDNGMITLDTFCAVFHIKDEVLAKNLFELIMGERDNHKMMNKFIMFDDFLVGVAICYQDERVDDGLTLFYSMMDREGDGYIKANDVLAFVKLVEENAEKQFGCDVNQFCLNIFDIQDIEAQKQLKFEQFKESVKFHKETIFVQQFLQFIIFTFLEIKLDENMIVVKKEE